MQEGGVIAYESHKLKNHEIDYPTHYFELAMIVMELKLWRHYLIEDTFQLKSDHGSLLYIFTQRDLNAHQQHWSDILSEYNFVIFYIKGKENHQANVVSCIPRIQSLNFLKVYLK
jgi:hypothetical protein